MPLSGRSQDTETLRANPTAKKNYSIQGNRYNVMDVDRSVRALAQLDAEWLLSSFELSRPFTINKTPDLTRVNASYTKRVEGKTERKSYTVDLEKGKITSQSASSY